MRKIIHGVDDIKVRISSLKGQNIQMSINRGRKRIESVSATIKDVYPSVFTIKTADEKENAALRDFLKSRDVLAVTHYVPLHSAPAGRKYGRFSGEDRYTTKESERLLRLPMYYGLSAQDAAFVADQVKEFYGA